MCGYYLSRVIFDQVMPRRGTEFKKLFKFYNFCFNPCLVYCGTARANAATLNMQAMTLLR